jgi:hypothetical protein
MGNPLTTSRSKGKEESSPQQLCDSDCLVIIAFSDYGDRGISPLLDFARRLAPAPHLLLYAGDAVNGIRINDLRRLAATAKYGLCAITDNRGPVHYQSTVRQVLVRKDVARLKPRGQGQDGSDVRPKPIRIGNYAVIGSGPNTTEMEDGSAAFPEELRATNLRIAARAAEGKHIIVLSDTPPRGILDLMPRWGKHHVGSRALCEFIRRRTDVPLVVCGRAHGCGGQSKQLGHSLVLNAASPPDPDQPAKVGTIEVRAEKVVSVRWQSLWDLNSISGIDEGRKLSLEKAGISTLRGLTEVSAGHVARAIRADYAESERLRAKALAFVQQDIVLLRNFALPVKNRVYINFEICNIEETVRLIGLHLESEDRTHVFFAETSKEEKQILGDMLRLLQPTAAINLIGYSVSLWQRQVLSKRLAFHRLPIGIARSIRDIFFEIEDCFAFPIPRLGLMQVAEWCGFKPHTSNAMHRGRVIQLCNPTQKLPRSQKRTLLRSSEEDLLALRHIVSYLEKLDLKENKTVFQNES